MTGCRAAKMEFLEEIERLNNLYDYDTRGKPQVLS